MIHVNRERAKPPSNHAKLAADAYQKAAHYFGAVRSKRLQRRWQFDARVSKNAWDNLIELFAGKCAYCETSVRTAFGAVDHFRPEVEATGLKKQSDPDHYWWLAYEWSNLYLACADCSRNKRTLFPVARRRAAPETRGDDLLNEGPLLLDPCRDEPGDYLLFDTDGKVSSRRPARFLPWVAGHDRGAITIQVLGLNRSTLVAQRRAVIKELNAELARWLSAYERRGLRALQQLEALFLHHLPFAGMRRQLVVDWVREKNVLLNLPEKVLAKHRGLVDAMDIVPTRKASGPTHRAAPRPARTATRAVPVRARPTTARVTTTTRATPAARPRRARSLVSSNYIQSIEIRNFRAIGHLRLAIRQGEAERVGWKVLLGENGTGKSSVLQAVALALGGEKLWTRLKIKPATLLRRFVGGRGVADSGSVRLEMSAGDEPIEIAFDAKQFRWVSGASQPRTMLRAYGATRLLARPQRKHAVAPDRDVWDADSLFDPFLPVCDAAAWLKQLRGSAAFASAALALKDLLKVPPRAELIRQRGGSVTVPINGVRHSLDEVSAGYESVLAMACDTMAGALGTVHDLRHAPGIVLLDEIDAHLHPRWKMRIVASLRNAFPAMQFLVTTHEPLCLRGLDEGEVAVLQRDGRKVIVQDDVPSPSGLRVDQLLTSPLFGLYSTIDPELDGKFMIYYALLAKRDEELSAAQRRQRDTLRAELSSVGILGSTRRDQLIYEVIDQYLAREPALHDAQQRNTLRDATKRKVAELWKRVELLEPS